MKKHGMEVIVAASPDETLHRFARAGGVESAGIEVERNRIAPLRDLVSIWRAWRQFSRLKPDIVHAHTPKGGVVGMVGAFLAGVNTRIYHVHGLAYLTSDGLYRRFQILLERLSCSLAHRVYFVSQSNLDLAIKDGLCNREKARILCHGSINGVDASNRFNPSNHARCDIRDQLRIPHDACVIGYVGRVINGKGIRELIQAWDNLSARRGNLYLAIVGPMEEKDAIPPHVRERILEDDRIRYVGGVDDTSPFYSIMDIFAFPTYREGFGLVAIEASAMEIPVVATKIPGVVDAVIDGDTGTLVPPGDRVALEQAIEAYLRNPCLRRRHGRNGRKRVLSDFRPQEIWDAQYRDYVALLNARVQIPRRLGDVNQALK